MNMIRTFVINLDKDTERMQFMHNQLTKLGITYERIPAIYGRDYQPLPKEYDVNIAVKKTGHALYPNELGCALSHKRVHEKIVAEKIPYSLIFEDDVLLPDNFKTIIEREIEQQITKNWEYLAFNYPVVGLPWIKKWCKSLLANYRNTKDKNLDKKIFFILFAMCKFLYIVPLSLLEGVRNKYKRDKPGPVIFLRPMYLAGAYIITLSGAQKLLELSQPVVYPADRLQNQARIKKGLICRCYAPLVVFQQNKEFGSSILELSGEEIV